MLSAFVDAVILTSTLSIKWETVYQIYTNTTITLFKMDATLRRIHIITDNHNVKITNKYKLLTHWRLQAKLSSQELDEDNIWSVE